jgi:uncharacterized protein YjbI with pentapeptide repeats
VGRKKPKRKAQTPPKGGIVWPKWTGFRGMTVRDWLQLLIVPFALAAIGFVFTMQQDARQQQIENQRAEAERELAEQRAQDEALQAYLDQMSGLLLEKDLRDSDEGSEVRTLARARTLTILGRLDPGRRTQVLRFLAEAFLVQRVEEKAPVINLSGANLQEVEFSKAPSRVPTDPGERAVGLAESLVGSQVSVNSLVGIDLDDADLSNASLWFVDLTNASLIRTDLSGAHLGSANLSEAQMGDADLSGANLSFAHLAGTKLFGTDLSGADLEGANLEGAYLNAANLSNANLSGANLGHAGLYMANLSGANLSGADLSNANLLSAEGVAEEELEQQAASVEAAVMPDGTFKAGQYVTHRAFEPTLSFNVSEDWRIPGVGSVTANQLIFEGPGGGQLVFINTLYVFDPDNPSERKTVPGPENADEWVSWFQRHPGLETEDPVPVSLGGASGVRIDVKPSTALENYPQDLCGEEQPPCVPLFLTNASAEGWKDRYVIVDVNGVTLLIDVAAPADEFEVFLPEAQKVLDTVEWQE